MRPRIGTRGSALALAQARPIAERLGGSLVTIATAGDRDAAAGDKSRWTGALEQALLAGEIDLAVHSAKDVPGALASGTRLVPPPPRADPRDVLVGFPSLAALPGGARVGTSALRRRAQLLAARPDLDVVELRGNVDTRLRKLAAGEVDALVLAAAGLERLAPAALPPCAPLDGALFVPAPGQGVLALQVRASVAAHGDADTFACLPAERPVAADGDADTFAFLPAKRAASADGDADTFACLLAERAAVAALGASCHTPVGVHAAVSGWTMELRGFAGLPDGSAWVLDELVADARDPEAAGGRLAQRMLAAGAGWLLERAEAAAAP